MTAGEHMLGAATQLTIAPGTTKHSAGERMEMVGERMPLVSSSFTRLSVRVAREAPHPGSDVPLSRRILVAASVDAVLVTTRTERANVCTWGFP